MSKPKLVVCGGGGRMGKRIIALAVEEGHFEISGVVEKAVHPDLGKDAALLAGAGAIGVNIGSVFPSEADIVIDFSSPDALEATLYWCLQKNASLVLGTTGLSAEQHKELEEAAEKIGIVYATNMSVGMNVLFHKISKIAFLLGEDYDTEIIEKHHRFKKDAPSGSALTLAEHICKATGKKFPDSIVNGRSGPNSLREKGTIGIHAVRAGDIVGEHEIIFSTLGETVSVKHVAQSRDCLARGALRAALWLIGKKPGLRTMADVLGLK